MSRSDLGCSSSVPEPLSKSQEVKCDRELAFYVHVHIVQNMTEPPRQSPSICLQRFEFKKALVMTANCRKRITIWFAHHAAFELKALLFCWKSCRGEKALRSWATASTFAKRTVSLNHTVRSYDSLDTSKNKHCHHAAGSGKCYKEGHGEVNVKLPAATAPWEGPARPPAPLAHTVELPPIEKIICMHFCY